MNPPEYQATPKLRLWLDAMIFLYSLAPVALLSFFYAYVVRARLELNRWPTPMQPDPKSLSFARDAHMDTIMWLFIFSVCCFIPWLLMICIRAQLSPPHRLFPTRMLLLLPWITVVAVCLCDPGSFVAWFLD